MTTDPCSPDYGANAVGAETPHRAPLVTNRPHSVKPDRRAAVFIPAGINPALVSPGEAGLTPPTEWGMGRKHRDTGT